MYSIDVADRMYVRVYTIMYVIGSCEGFYQTTSRLRSNHFDTPGTSFRHANTKQGR